MLTCNKRYAQIHSLQMLLFVWIFVLCVMGMAPGLLNPYNSGFLIPIWTNLSAEASSSAGTAKAPTSQVSILRSNRFSYFVRHSIQFPNETIKPIN